MMNKLADWIKAERGRLSKLAVTVGVTPSAIAQWDRVPAERIGTVSNATGIPMEELRPDLFKSAAATSERAA